jgi:hypothetical protein
VLVHCLLLEGGFSAESPILSKPPPKS